MTVAGKIFKALTGRVARNIYFWVFNIWLMLELNQTSARKRGLNIESPWYARIVITETVLLILLTYLNNLWLVPRYLAMRKYKVYFPVVTLLISAVAVLQVMVLKAGDDEVNLEAFQQLGVVSILVSDSWSAGAILLDSIPYFMGHAAWVFFFTAAWFMQDYARQKKIAEDAKKKQVEAELHFLKNQVNPHFLFNTLNNLYSLALKKSDKNPDAILRLSSILRYLLYDSDTEKVPFEKEEEIMKAYIDLELLRLPDNEDFNFTIHADGNYSIPPLLWLPILENVFKHATRIITDKYYIDYRFVIEGGKMNIYSKNNYKSVLNGEAKKAGGIGLENLRKRLALLYPGKHSLNSHAEGEHYVVNLQIDVS